MLACVHARPRQCEFAPGPYPSANQAEFPTITNCMTGYRVLQYPPVESTIDSRRVFQSDLEPYRIDVCEFDEG